MLNIQEVYSYFSNVQENVILFFASCYHLGFKIPVQFHEF